MARGLIVLVLREKIDALAPPNGVFCRLAKPLSPANTCLPHRSEATIPDFNALSMTPEHRSGAKSRKALQERDTSQS